MDSTLDLCADDGFSQLANISLDKISRNITADDIRKKRTHIVCTMGPAVKTAETVVELIDAGLNVCRFNFSHGDHQSQKQMLMKVQQAMEKRPHANIGS